MILKYRHKMLALLALVIMLPSFAQQPIKPTATQIYESIQKLNVLGSVLYIAAHPDDENTRLISYMSNQVKARTAYLSLTRGDGGQNLIGPEIRELLGVMRTQELLEARKIDGGEQLFTRANDFGYSKHPDETFAIWNKDEVLSDVVQAIRTFKPDVIINRFDHRTPGKTHGHHTGSAILGIEAFNLSNNNAYKTKLVNQETWQPKRLFFNTSWWFYGSKENFQKADKSNLISVDIGVYYPLKGLSNNEIAALSRSKHLCQGFGALTQRGSQLEYLEIIKGDKPRTNNIFEGIDTSWSRVEGGKKIGELLHTIDANFNFEDPSVHIPKLLEAYQLIKNINNSHWKTIKLKEIKAIIQACLGLYLEAKADHYLLVSNKTTTFSVEAINRSNVNVELLEVEFLNNSEYTMSGSVLKNNIKYTNKKDVLLPKNTIYNTAHWLQEKGSLGMYRVNNSALINKPENTSLQAVFKLKINNVSIAIKKPIVYRYSKPDKGELYKPVYVVPKASVSLNDKVYVFSNTNSKTISATVKSNVPNLKGVLKLKHPKDWNVVPHEASIDIAKKGDQQTVIFSITPPNNQSEGDIIPELQIDNQKINKALIHIDYNHIPHQTVLLDAKSKVVKLDVKTKGKHIGYIEGAGDVIPESLKQIGYKVTTVKPEQINTSYLKQFDAIVIGIRAYNTVEALNFKQDVLFNYVHSGGTMLVQYNTRHRLKVDNLAPYNLKLSRDRVTNEAAKVTILEPNHSLLNYPNKITTADFNGWVQERGLYFPNQWDNSKFTTLLSMHDTGETPKTGSLLVAKHGKGYYIYTGLSLFRELPAGVPGAYRLLANFVSAGN